MVLGALLVGFTLLGVCFGVFDVKGEW